MAMIDVLGTGVMVFLALLAISIFLLSHDSHRHTLEMQKVMHAGAAIAASRRCFAQQKGRASARPFSSAAIQNALHTRAPLTPSVWPLM
ncbi:MAG TPA: hypothetical protein VIR56_10565 [Solimonas sp.]